MHLADPKYLIFGGKRGVAAGKVCYDADPTQLLTGPPFRNMYALRVDPKSGYRMFLKFERREDAFKWDRFKAGDWIAFEGCLHEFKSNKSGTKIMGKGTLQLRVPIGAIPRQVVFDISRITLTESKNI